MDAKPSRDQKTPSQSHSTRSYPERAMGGDESFHRNDWEPFDQKTLGSKSHKNPSRDLCIKNFR